MNKREDCHHLITTLSDYVDGSLDENLCSELEMHLRNCKDCRIVVDTLRKTIDLYHTTNTSPTMPDEVRERLYHRLDLEEYMK